MTPLWLIVLKKELSEALRERRTLGLLLMFTLFYPALIGLMLHKAIERGTRTEKAGIELVVIGAAQAPNLMALLRQKNVIVSERDAIVSAIRSAKVESLSGVNV